MRSERRKRHSRGQAPAGVRRPPHAGREEPSSRSRARRRLRQLYAIGEMLARSGETGTAVPSVLAALGEAVALDTVVLLTGPRGHVRSTLWRAGAVSDEALRAADARARDGYAYLGRWPPDDRGDGPAGSPVAPGADPAAFVLLPLSVGHAAVFGVLQCEGERLLDEQELGFIGAVTTQLAVALDREALIQGAAGGRSGAEAGADRLDLAFADAVSRVLVEGVIAVDAGGHVRLWSPVAEAVLGWTEGEALGRPADELLRVRKSAGARAVLRPLAEAMRTGSSLQRDDHVFEDRHGRSLRVSFTAAPIQRDDRTAGAVLVFRRVIEKRGASLLRAR